MSETADPAGRPPRRTWSRWKRLAFRWRLNVYGPFLGAGIRIAEIAPDLSRIVVRLKLTRYNRNYVGTHFGGSLYTMCDPFFMVMLIELLGRDYIVWDKAAKIRFLRPGRGTVTAEFVIPPDEVEHIRHLADTNRKVEPTFTAEVRDEKGETVAKVEKLLYVRRKDAVKKRS